MIRGELFIFKGIYFWRPKQNSIAIKIRDMWPSLPENLEKVDSVHDAEDGMTWFFVGRDIYVFDGNLLKYQSSLTILGISHEIQRIDAIFKWPFNKRTYIFSGDWYWRFEADEVAKGYPIQIQRSWNEVYDVDTAYSDNNKLYFFKGKFYYEFDAASMSIDRMDPLPVAQEFMKCPHDPKVYITNRFGDPDKRTDVIDNWQDKVLPKVVYTNPEKNSTTEVTSAPTKNNSTNTNSTNTTRDPNTATSKNFSGLLLAFSIVVIILSSF